MTTPGSNGPDQQPGGGAPGWGQPPAGPPGGYSPPPPPPPGGSTPPPPPPPGGYAQGQHQPQPGASPYPPQGGAPYPPQGGAPYQPQPGGFGGPPKKSGPPKWLIPVIAGVVLVAGALALFAFLGGSGSEVDDCVSANAAGEVETVDCDDDSAVARVVGFDDDDITYDDYLASDDDFCSGVDGAVTHFWEGEEGEEGRVVCVGEI
ncbi:hypothetical protein [Blastococcus sp. SYSU D00813]